MADLASLTPGQRLARDLAIDGPITQQNIDDAARGAYGEVHQAPDDYAASFLTEAQAVRLRTLAAMPSLNANQRNELDAIKQAYVQRCAGPEPERVTPETADSWRARHHWDGLVQHSRDSFDLLWGDARREASRTARLRQAAE